MVAYHNYLYTEYIMGLAKTEGRVKILLDIVTMLNVKEIGMVV